MTVPNTSAKNIKNNKPVKESFKPVKETRPVKQKLESSRENDATEENWWFPHYFNGNFVTIRTSKCSSWNF